MEVQKLELVLYVCHFVYLSAFVKNTVQHVYKEHVNIVVNLDEWSYQSEWYLDRGSEF